MKGSMVDMEKTIVALYRFAHPRSRVVSMFRYYLNTGRRASKQCIACGEIGPTWCAVYPKTRRAEDWETAHAERHYDEVCAAQGKL